MGKVKKDNFSDRQFRREELLRPSRYLGYEHDAIGVYTFNRGAYSIAEKEFRRAIWLNPYEPEFKIHLAWCLYKLKDFDQARKLVSELTEQKFNSVELKDLAECLKSVPEHR